jgi:hypothetical protein
MRPPPDDSWITMETIRTPGSSLVVAMFGFCLLMAVGAVILLL